MRYLAELVLAPHAMLYNPKLSWREIENGDITRVEADDRPRIAGRCTVPTRWEGRCYDYRELDRCRIPTRPVANWLLEDGPFEYWRGQVTGFRIK